MPEVRDVIYDLLEIVRRNLNDAINDLRDTDPGTNSVVLGNLAMIEPVGGTPTPSVENAVVMTLFKIEEEYALKNKPAYRRNPVTNRPENVNPPAFLNLHILIASTNTTYMNALENISFVVGYLQHKNVFNNLDPSLEPGNFQRRYHFNINMVKLSYEQLNHIWGIFGGKHYPCVMYKLQLIEVHFEPDNFDTGHLITEISSKEKIY